MDSTWIFGNAAPMRDLVQILFFVLVGVLSFLTYRQARRTVLQPIKSETYKVQLRLFDKLTELLGSPTELQLCSTFGFNELSEANAARLIDDFVRDHSDKEIDISTRPYALDKCPQTVINLKSRKAGDWVLPLSPLDDQLAVGGKAPEETKTNWVEYCWEEIHLPLRYLESRARVSELRKSPFMPERIATRLALFEARLDENFDELKGVLDECGRHLEQIFLQSAGPMKLNRDWIHNRYNRRFKPLLDLAGC